MACHPEKLWRIVFFEYLGKCDTNTGAHYASLLDRFRIARKMSLIGTQKKNFEQVDTPVDSPTFVDPTLLELMFQVVRHLFVLKIWYFLTTPIPKYKKTASGGKES